MLIYVSHPYADSDMEILRHYKQINKTGHSFMFGGNESFDDDNDNKYLIKSNSLIRQCDVVVRVGGESEHADAECDYAIDNAIPVCNGIDGLCVFLAHNT